VCRWKVTVALDGGTIGSGDGIVPLAGADRGLDLIDTLASLTPDERGPT
jgi:hypothetical protein